MALCCHLTLLLALFKVGSPSLLEDLCTFMTDHMASKSSFSSAAFVAAPQKPPVVVVPPVLLSLGCS